MTKGFERMLPERRFFIFYLKLILFYPYQLGKWQQKASIVAFTFIIALLKPVSTA
jgi:hypothetical protein